jgi:hypothetical protein
MRAKLHVMFVINGNGFYYGRLMADYTPMAYADDVTVDSLTNFRNAVPASQRMKVFINPSNNCSCQMELPFVNTFDAISPVDASWSSMGNIAIRELVGLKHANGSTQPLTLTTFAWATDVELSLPTSTDSSALVAQAGDEYEAQGPVANMATAAADMAGLASRLPVIGKYARATQLVSGGVARAASLLGWSRPAIIRPSEPMRPTFISSLAPGDAGDNVTKLTVDSKQEVTVDTGVIGIQLPDELSIPGIAARESYLTQFTWTTAAVAGDLLFNAAVTPHALVRNTSDGTLYLPACAFAVLPFRFWRCKMRYRFQVVASAHHKGRLRFVWDPLYVQSLEANVQLTRVVDISNDQDVTIDIDWGQTQHYFEKWGTDTLAGSCYGTAARTASAVPFANGVLGVYVLNDLATPNSTVNNDVVVNVFISAVDLEVRDPQPLVNRGTSYAWTVQAGEDAVASHTDGSEDVGAGPATADHNLGNAPEDDHIALVYFGERIENFRQILRRYNFHSTAVFTNVNTDPALWTMVQSDVPPVFGYNNQTLHTSGANKFNYVNYTLLDYLMPAFCCMRGGMRSKYVVSAPTGAIQTAVVRRSTPLATLSVPTAPTTIATTTQSAYAKAAIAARSSLTIGAAATPVSRQPVLEVEHPYYKPCRFDEAKSAKQNRGAYQSPFFNTHALDITTSPSTDKVVVDRYTSVAEDFSLMWFQGCPPLRVIVAP